MDDDRSRRPVAHAVRWGGESVLLLLAFGTAWPSGSVDAHWESVATAGAALLTALWAIHAGLTRRIRLVFDAPALLLSGLILLSGLQLVPLPRELVQVVSPSTVTWRDALIPAELERLPGETATVKRPTSFPISLDPSATRIFAGRILGLLAVYLAARNWLADRASFRRLAWAALVNGVALAALALGQYFSSPPNVVYWTYVTDGQVFGPFVCRNHYPDFVALCAGLALGIMVNKRMPSALGAESEFQTGTFLDELREMAGAPLQLLQEPAVLASSASVGLMLVSIPFSLSRGGMLALLAATVGVFLLARWRTSTSAPSGNRLAATVSVAVAMCVVAWFGWAPIEKRFDEIGSGRAIDDRTPIWNSTFRQLPGFWLTGAGNGSHSRIEPLGRDEGGLTNVTCDHAHNEYLEAAIEGGMLRLGITFALPASVLVSLARGYRKLRDRSAGPLILGSLFGLATVALHAITDFALHLPAVSLLTVVVAAFGMAASNDAEFHPTRAPRPRSAKPPAAAFALTGSLALMMGLLAFEAHQRYVADEFLTAGLNQQRSVNPEIAKRRIEWLEASIAADAHNPDAHFQLAQAHLDAAHDLGPNPAEALAGPILPRRARPDRYSPALVAEHILPALRSLRTGRELGPLHPGVHARLGLLAEYFAQSEPALVHLDRAKSLVKTDPDIWFACGVEAAKVGDGTRAVAEWKKSLELSSKQLPSILREAGKTMPPETVLNTLLPDDPAIVLAAADDLHPNRQSQRSERRAFLEKAVVSRAVTVPQWVATAKAFEELDRLGDARRAWEKAIELEPGRIVSHEGLVRLLESEELYAEALPQLEWLLARRSNDADLRLRHKAATHGAKLQRMIGE